MDAFMGQSRFAHGEGQSGNGNGNGMHGIGDGAGGVRPRGLEDSPSGLVGEEGAALSALMGEKEAAPSGTRRPSPEASLRASGVPSAAAPVAEDPALRDRLGRFRPGTCGGPGNPFGREVALLRCVFLERISPEKFAALVDKAYEMAMEGDRVMMKLVFQQLLGKPTPMTNPDRVEHEEWEMRQEQPHIAEFEDQQLHRHPHTLANVLHREADRTKGADMLAQIDANAAARLAEEKKQAERAERRREKKEERQRRKHGG